MKRFRQMMVWTLTALMASGCIHIHNREAFYFGSYSEAEQLYKKGEYEKAIQKYQAYIDENPEGNLAVISTYYIARSHDNLAHVDEAKALYKEIVEKHPTVIWANFSQTRLKELETVKVDPKVDTDPKISESVTPAAQPDADAPASSPKKKKRFFFF